MVLNRAACAGDVVWPHISLPCFTFCFLVLVTMEIYWGQYLCRGVSSSFAQKPEEDRSKQLMVRLEKALRLLGLTLFNARVIIQYISVCLFPNASHHYLLIINQNIMSVSIRTWRR
jgi:hypothetical protein